MTDNECAIYLDFQASTPLDQRVAESMQPYLFDNYANPHSSDHAQGWLAADAIYKAAEQVAELVGANPDEVIFTSGATEANNLAILGPARKSQAQSRNRILVSAAEHKCVLAAARAAQEQLGFLVEQIPVDSTGRIEVADLEHMIGEDVLLVSAMAVNNEVGTINDIPALAALCRTHGAILHCDAAQAPCAMNIAEIAFHADLVSLSAHKMYGPKGIGALIIRSDLQGSIEPIIYGGGQQGNLRSGTLPVPLCVGMGVAAELCSGRDATNERRHISRLRDRLVEGLMNLPWKVVLNGTSLEGRHPGNANIMFPGFSAQDILARVQPSLSASTGSACTSGTPEPSHVLRAMGLDEASADASIRFSVGRPTTEKDIDRAVAIIDEALISLSATNESRPVRG